jgi:hypothetical protein
VDKHPCPEHDLNLRYIAVWSIQNGAWFGLLRLLAKCNLCLRTRRDKLLSFPLILRNSSHVFVKSIVC